MPTSSDVSERLSTSKGEVEHALRRLADSHGVVLHPHICEPWVMHPFSASPTATWVEAHDKGWWAPCMWCACGVATLAGGEVTIHTRVGGEREDIDIHVINGYARESDLWVRFAIPPHAAWENVHHFCATVLPFRQQSDVAGWCARHGIPLGAIVPMPQVMDLGRKWYAGHVDPDWKRWSVHEAGAIFRSVGLVDAFWDLPATEGGF